MNEKVVYGLLAFLTKTTPIDNGKNLPLKVTNHNNFTQSCPPSEEGNTRWTFTFQMLFHGKREASLDCRV
jgi:hypothetical protein